MREATGQRDLTPADYASTTGLILELDDDVWVNAPIIDYNPNFVSGSRFVVDHGTDGFWVHGAGPGGFQRNERQTGNAQQIRPGPELLPGLHRAGGRGAG